MRRGRQRLRARRGSALILVLLMTLAVAALAIAAIFMSSSAGLLSRFYDRDRQFAYAADAAIARVVSQLQLDTTFSVSSTTPSVVLDLTGVTDADGDTITGAAVRVWAARTSDTSTSGPVTVSLLAQVYDASGTRRARRVDLRQESFAQYGYVVNNSTTSSRLAFAQGAVQVARIHSNADWFRVTSAEYRDSVTASGTVSTTGGAVFHRGQASDVARLPWPDDDVTLDSLEALASARGLDFDENSNYEMRVEFVWVDADADSVADRNEGFVRIFDFEHWDNDRLAAEPTDLDYYAWDDDIIQNQCGAFYQRSGVWQFFPVATHRADWAIAVISGAGTPAAPSPASIGLSGDFYDHSHDAVRAILSLPTARCFPAGSPYLVNTERFTNASGDVGVGSGYNYPFGVRSAAQYGGQDTTLTMETRSCTIEDSGGQDGERCDNNGDTDALGSWRTLSAVSGGESLAPLDTADAGVVLHFSDDVWLSGTVVGRVTLATRGDAWIVDDIRYGGGPHAVTDDCGDLFGVVAREDIRLMESAILRRARVGWGSQAARNTYVTLGGKEGVELHGAFFSLLDSFGPETSNDQMGNVDASQFLCEGSRYSMGCVRHSGSAAMDMPYEFSDDAGEGARYLLTRDACFDAGYRPPAYPLTNRYRKLRAVDVRPASIIGVNGIENYFALLQGPSDIP